MDYSIRSACDSVDIGGIANDSHCDYDSSTTSTARATGVSVYRLVRNELFVVVLTAGFFTTPVLADVPEFKLAIESHRFVPAELTVPAGQKIKLTVENRDATPEEFESYDFNREKIVPGKGRIILFVGPLKPGRYEFFGEFHMETARGFLIAE